MKNSISLSSRFAFLALVAAIFALTPEFKAATVTSTVNEDNGATNSAGDGNQAIYDVPTNHPAIVPTAGGYDFSSGANAFSNLGGTIAQITFTMTMQDGDSGSAAQEGGTADFDFDHLFLYLGAPADYDPITGTLTGGVNTGIVLNGFRGFGLQDTQTFTMSIDSATSTALLSELSTGGGHLDAWVVSNNAGDTMAAPNEVFVGNDALDATTTLTLDSVPEPAVPALVGLGLLILLAPRVRRLRRHG
jgi:hypothetical protein